MSQINCGWHRGWYPHCRLREYHALRHLPPPARSVAPEMRDLDASHPEGLRYHVRMPSPQAVRDPQTYAIIGAAMDVHRHLGAGFLEAVYREALVRELTTRAVPHRTEVPLRLWFKGQALVTMYRADLVCFERIIVELKAVRSIAGPEEAHILNYLKASGFACGLILNFGATRLEYRRFIWTARPTARPGSA